MHKAMTEQFHTFYRNLMLFAMPETSCQEWYYTNDVAKSFCADKVRRVCQILQDGFALQQPYQCDAADSERRKGDRAAGFRVRSLTRDAQRLEAGVRRRCAVERLDDILIDSA